MAGVEKLRCQKVSNTLKIKVIRQGDMTCMSITERIDQRRRRTPKLQEIP